MMINSAQVIVTLSSCKGLVVRVVEELVERVLVEELVKRVIVEEDRSRS